MKTKIFHSIVLFIVAFLFSPLPTFAHVVVKPNSVGIGTYQSFTVGVPVEKDMPTTELRLVIPEGLAHITPNVKPGWKITVKKAAEGEDSAITEIKWEGGIIPEGQRDEFVFSAKVPASATELHWKAYQTYQDGTVVAWDAAHEAETGHSDTSAEKSGPYSTTQVVDDLKAYTSVGSTQSEQYDTSMILSVFAISLSVLAIAMQLRKKN